MSSKWISPYRSQLLGKSDLSVQLLARIVQRADGVDERDIEFARTLTTQSLDFLSYAEVRGLIRADLDENDVARISNQKSSFFARMTRLIPEVFRYLKPLDNDDLLYVVRRTYDTCRDFQLASDGPRRDKRISDLKRRIGKAGDAANRALAALKAATEDISYLFTSAHTARLELEFQYDEENITRFPEAINFENLLRQLEATIGIVDIIKLDLGKDQPRTRVYGASTKADLVVCAYDFHRVCGGPPLVTTPGSDFSYICGLLFEVATGVPDESLSGAINRFARSRDRLEQDEFDLEQKDDETAFESNDNFHGVRTETKRLMDDGQWFRDIGSHHELSEFGRLVALSQAVSSFNKALAIRAENGPFIVWASHEPELKTQLWRDTFEASDERLRQTEIALGQQRRSKKSTVDAKSS